LRAGLPITAPSQAHRRGAQNRDHEIPHEPIRMLLSSIAYRLGRYARHYLNRRDAPPRRCIRALPGTRVFCVDGRDETVIREYIRNQEQEDARLNQMNLWRWPATDKVAPRSEAR